MSRGTFKQTSVRAFGCLHAELQMKGLRNNQPLINECEHATARVLTAEMQLSQISIPAAATITPLPSHSRPSSLADYDVSMVRHSGCCPSLPDCGAGMDGFDGKEKNCRGNFFFSSLPKGKKKSLRCIATFLLFFFFFFFFLACSP